MTPISKVLAYAPPLIALAGIVTAILTSGNWHPLHNAISDLGTPEHDLVTAIILNVVFTISGYLLIICTLLNRNLLDRTELYLLQGAGISLNLVAVINESYGLAHFIISAILFIILGAYVLYNIAKHRPVMLVLFTLVSLTLWIAHLTLSVPKGAAIPELATILTATICYIKYTVSNKIRRRKLHRRPESPRQIHHPHTISVKSN